MNLILDLTDGTNGATVNISVTPFDEHPLREFIGDDLSESLGGKLAALDGDHLVEFVFDKGEIPASTIEATAGALRGLGLSNAARAWSAAHRQGSAAGVSNVVAFRPRATI